jgi:hypothetical protein
MLTYDVDTDTDNGEMYGGTLHIVGTGKLLRRDVVRIFARHNNRVEILDIGPGFTGVETMNDLDVVHITFSPQNITMDTLPPSCFYRCRSLRRVQLPVTLFEIPEFCFAGCTQLVQVTIPDTVRVVGTTSFYECAALETITIPSNVTVIQDYAFRDCSKLKEVNFSPNSLLTSLGDATFMNTVLSKVTLPDSLLSIGSHTFYGVYTLKSMTVNRLIWKDIYPTLVPKPGFDRYVSFGSGSTTVYVNRTNTNDLRPDPSGQVFFQEPEPEPVPEPEPEPETLTTATVAGIVGGCLFVILVIVFLIYNPSPSQSGAISEDVPSLSLEEDPGCIYQNGICYKYKNQKQRERLETNLPIVSAVRAVDEN